MFFWNSLAFLMIQQMLAIWYLVHLHFLNPSWTSGSSWFMYCWNLAWKILSITLLACAAAAAAKSLQSCPTLCDPIRRQPRRLPRPWDSPGKNTGVGCHLRWVQLWGSLSILWHCLSLGLEWKLTLSSPVAIVKFSKLLAYWVQHFHRIIFQDFK